jgi:catechol 2,3-dioxygenase-like lactoylglutathione lyase family enzyme
MLKSYPLSPTIPVQDVERARKFYLETLGLEPGDMSAGSGGLLVKSGGAHFLLYPTEAPRGGHTLASWPVTDLAAEMADLRARGIVFEDYDLPGLKTVDGVYAADGRRGAWFRDSEDNILALMEV